MFLVFVWNKHVSMFWNPLKDMFSVISVDSFFLIHLRSTCDVVSIFFFTLKSIRHFKASYQYILTMSEVPYSNHWGIEERKIEYFPIVLHFQNPFLKSVLHSMWKDFLQGAWLAAFCFLKIALWCKKEWKPQTSQFSIYILGKQKWQTNENFSFHETKYFIFWVICRI